MNEAQFFAFLSVFPLIILIYEYIIIHLFKR